MSLKSERWLAKEDNVSSSLLIMTIVILVCMTSSSCQTISKLLRGDQTQVVVTKKTTVLYGAKPTLFGGVSFNSCKSFLSEGTLFHSAGQIYQLDQLRRIATATDRFGQTVDVVEAEDGTQIYISDLYLEVSGPNGSEVLVQANKLDEYKTAINPPPEVTQPTEENKPGELE